VGWRRGGRGGGRKWTEMTIGRKGKEEENEEE